MAYPAPSPSSDPLRCNCYAYFIKQNGDAAVGVPVTFKLLPLNTAVANTSGVALLNKSLTAFSNNSGLMQVSIPRNDQLLPGATQWSISIPQCTFTTSRVIATSLFNIGALIV